MLLSVIVCTWNRRALLSETLRCIGQQQVSSASDIEVIVVDNNSTDGTEDLVRSLCPTWQMGALRYVRENQQGKQFALNAGIRAAGGDLLAFTDDDVILPEDWLAKGIRALSDKQVELVGGRTLLKWPNNTAPGWFASSMLAVVAGVDLGIVRLQPPPPDYAPSGTNLFVRRAILGRTGLFSEAHFRHMDYEFGMRAARAGIRLAYNPELVVYTRVPPEIINKRYFRRWYFKLGIAAAMQEPDSSPHWLLVPRWIWRQVTTDMIIVSAGYFIGQGNRIFARDLRLHQLRGFMVARWHRRLFPNRHATWVQRHSQKRGEIFD